MIPCIKRLLRGLLIPADLYELRAARATPRDPVLKIREEREREREVVRRTAFPVEHVNPSMQVCRRISEIEASLVYIINCRTARAT